MFQLKRYLQNLLIYSTITYEDLIKTLDTIVKDDTLLESRSGESIAYFIVENPGSVFVPDIQDISNIPNNNLFNGNQKLNLQKTNMWKCEKCNKCVNVKTTQENMSLATYDNILNEIKNF